MGYVGNQTTNSYSSMDKQVITGNGGASYTLTHAVANAQEIEVFVNNVRQEAGVAYTVAGTALSMTGNVASSDSFYVIYQGKALQTVVPPDGSVSTGKLANNAVTMDKLATSGTLPALDGSALTGLSAIGVGQSWSDVTSSRTSGTTYTNSTGKPIMVSVSTNMGTNQRLEATVGGVKIADMGGSTIYGDMGLNVFIVPDNTTYVVTATQGTIQIWAELR